jgi:hypothetical protein
MSVTFDPDSLDDGISNATHQPTQNLDINEEVDTSARAVNRLMRVGAQFAPLARQDQAPSLANRLTRGAISNATPAPIQVATEAPAQKTSLELLQEVLLEEPSYLQNISNLVAKILKQLSDIGEKDRKQIDEMKKKYETTYKQSAGLVKDIAWNDMLFSGFALIPLVLSFSPNQFDKDMGGRLAADFVPGLGRMYNSGSQADMRKADALAQLLMQEYGAKTSKSSSEGNNKQEITNMLDKAVSALKDAARAG